MTKCVFCGKATEGDCICSKCKPKMYQYPSVRQKFWSALKHSIKSLFKR